MTPTPCDVLIVHATILDPESAGVVLEDQAIAIVADQIVAVDSTKTARVAWAGARTINATGMVVTPGFVDSHVHLSAYLGASRPYQPAIEPGLFSGACRIGEIGEAMAQLMSIPVPDSLMATVARAAFIAMVRSGITSIVDAGSSAHNRLITAANHIRIRAATGPSLADTSLGTNGALSERRRPSELIEAARSFLDEHRSSGPLITPMISAADTISCSDELLQSIAELSREHQTPTHIHSHISPPSNQAHLDAYGRSETDRLLDAGMLTGQCTLMHVGAIDDTDLESFIAGNVTVNHNPLGNAMLGFGIARHQVLRQLLDARVPVVMGSDYSPSMCATPFDMIRATLAVHREAAAADNAITLEEALQMATHPGRGDCGSVKAGHLADLVLIDVTGAHHAGVPHPVPNVALRARDSDIATIIINGTIVIDDHQLVGHDEAAIVNEASKALKLIASR